MHADFWYLKNEIIFIFINIYKVSNTTQTQVWGIARSHDYIMFITLILTSLILTVSSAIILTINPLSLGIVILITALTLTLIYSLILTSWIAFLIFLIYIGGILVIFAYFVALTPNQQKTEVLIIPIFITFFISIFTIFILNTKPIIININIKYIYTFYITRNIQLLLVLALILLFTIIVVVKLVTNNKGPLRPFYNYV